MSGRKSYAGRSAESWFHSKSGQILYRKASWETKGPLPPLHNLAPPLLTLLSRPHHRLQTSFPPIRLLYIFALCFPPPSPAPGFPSTPPASSPPDSLRVLQWNAEGLRARSTELLHFLSFYPVDFIYIQESNLNSSSSFRIPGFSALRSDRTHSQSAILSSDTTHVSGGVIFFVRQGLSFSKLSTSSLSSLHPYSDFIGINISLNNSSSRSFLNVYASPPYSLLPNGCRTDSFSPSILPSSRNLFILGDFNCHHPLWDSRRTSDPCGKEVFDWVISSDLLPLNDHDTPTLLHCSSPDISFAPSLLPFLAPGKCYRTLVLTTYQFFYLSLSLRPLFVCLWLPLLFLGMEVRHEPQLRFMPST